MKMLYKHYFFTIFVGLLIIGCVSQPRYTSYPIEGKRPSPIEEKDKSKKETLPFEKESESKIDQAKMAKIIESFLGTPYAKGGASKKGIDCSGIVVEVYKRYAGFILPHNTEKLFKLVKKVDKEKLGYGDLVFFSDFGLSPSLRLRSGTVSNVEPSHVGIYIGEGKFVHSTEGYGVIVSSLDDESYRKRYIGARRVIP
jgi:cell wall-associated NlpC family hydrolase